MTNHILLRPPIPSKIVGVLAVSIGLAAAGATMAAPANADLVNDNFLSALSNAGVAYGDPANTVQMAQSVCPLLAQPGGNVASVASRMAGNNGIAPDMAGLFTSIAISMYCPNVMASFANGDWLNNGDILGPFGLPGLPGI